LTRIFSSSLLKWNYSKICNIISVSVNVVCSTDIHCVRKVEKIVCGVVPSVYLLTLVARQNLQDFFINKLCLCSLYSEKIGIDWALRFSRRWVLNTVGF